MNKKSRLMIIDHWLFSTKDFPHANQRSFLRHRRHLQRIPMEACHDSACSHPPDCLLPIESACHIRAELAPSHIWHTSPRMLSSACKSHGPIWICPVKSNRNLVNRRLPMLLQMLPRTKADKVCLDKAQENGEENDWHGGFTVVDIIRGDQIGQ